MSEGYIYSVPKKGYYVSDISGVARIKPVKYEVPETTAKKKTGYKSDLSSNRTDPGSFPFATWAKLMRRVITDRQDDLMKISPAASDVYKRQVKKSNCYASGFIS